jgi:hypothetical protein
MDIDGDGGRENSDFVANAAEQKVIREPRKFALRPSKKSLPSKSAMALPTNPLPSVKS